MDVNEIMRNQYGVVTADQARRAEISRREIQGRVARGEWLRVHRGVYRSAAVAANWRADVLAATLAVDGPASHKTAAALWGLEPFVAPRPEVTVRHGSRRAAGDAIVHQTTQWSLRNEVERHGIRCTGVERTILDVGGVCRLRTLERVAESAIRQRHTSWKALLRCLWRHSRQGRTGCGGLRELLALRLGDNTVPLSDFSREVVNLLGDHGIPAPLIEHKIFDERGDFIMQTDLAWPEKKKAWELDGLRYHFGRTDVERDRRKRNRAKAAGWNIQEILWSMYRDDPEDLVQLARDFLRPQISGS